MIPSTIIDNVVAKVAEDGPSEQTITALRAEWPGVHFTYCMDDDIVNKQPARQAESFNIYLIDAREHCLSITSDQNVATGLVIAEKLDWGEESDHERAGERETD